MVKFKKVDGKTWKRCPGAPALWCNNQNRVRLSNMQLEDLRDKLKKGKRIPSTYRRG